MKYYNNEIIKYNSQLYEKYHKDIPRIQLGYFNFPHILVIGLNPKYVEEDPCEEMFHANNYEEHMKLYRKCIINAKGTKTINNLIDLSSYYVSFTNIVKVQTLSEQDITQEMIDLWLPVTKKQIEIFNPNLVIVLGKTAKNLLLSEDAEFNKLYEIDNILYYPVYHYSYLMRHGLKYLRDYYSKTRDEINEICKKKCVIKITNQKIYYRDIDGEKKWYQNTAQKYYFVPDDNGEYISVFYDKLRKVYDYNSNDINTFEKHLTKSDIFLYENLDVKYSKHYKFCTIDIETNFCNTPLKPEKEILTISTCNSVGDLYNIFVYNPNKQEIRQEEFGNVKILNFTSEKEMIETFFKMLSIVDFDIIIGWFSNKFDIPYLFYRAKLLKIDLNKYLDDINMFEDNISCSSIYFLDAKDFIHDFMNTIISAVPVSMSLNSIAELVLHDKKEDVLPSEIPEIWQNNINLLIKYNIKDVYLTHNIIIAAKIIDYITLRLNIVSGNLDRIIHNSLAIEMLLHKKYFNQYKFPTKIKNNNNNSDEIEGGLVLDPVKGRYKNVAVYDFSSMYPSIVMTFNISPEMSKNISHNPSLNENIVIDNVKFSTHSTGMFPELEIELLQMRAKYKNEMKKYDINDIKFRYYNVLQGLVKQIANSLYGVTAYKKFFLYNPLIGKSITYIGRNLLLYVKNFVESLGYKVIYGDTDSIFVKFPDSINDIVSFAVEIEKKINLSLYDFVRKYIKDEEFIKSHMRLKVSLGYVYSLFFLTDAKKKYFGRVIYYDGKMLNKFHTMGFEIKKHDTPVFFVSTYSNIYNYILDNNVMELVKYIKSLYKSIREVSTDDLLITIKLGRNTEEYQNNNEYISAIKKASAGAMRGDYVKFIYTKSGLQVYEKQIRKEDIDYDKYITKFLLNKIKIIDENVYNDVMRLLSNQKSLDVFDFK